jgi:capsular exopolysaccharide synthesis family protein
LDLRDYLRVLSRRWRFIGALALLGAGLSTFATFTATPEYRATTTLFVSMKEGADTNSLNAGNMFTQARVQSYADMAASPLVTRPVVRQLHLGITPGQLARKISASAKPDTVLLRITVSDFGPRRAAQLSNAVAVRFAAMVGTLEKPGGAKTTPVKLSITTPAAVPSVPSSPRPLFNLALGLLSGLAVGVGCAVLRESLDTSVRNNHALADFMAGLSGPPVLGSIVLDSRTPRHPVAARDDTHGLRAEGFRRLGTNLRFVDVDRPPKVIAVTSAVPGEGKTSVAVNLAATLAEAGARVCLVDTDLRRPTAARALGLIGDAGLTTVLIGQAQLEYVVQQAGSFSVLASGPVPPNPAELLGSGQFRSAISTLSEDFDHIVIDTAPVLPVTDAAVIAPVVDGYLLVVRAGKTSRTQVTDALGTLRRTDTPVLGAVLNMAPLKGEGSVYGYAYTYRPERERGQSRGPLRLRRRDERRRTATIPSYPLLPRDGAVFQRTTTGVGTSTGLGTDAGLTAGVTTSPGTGLAAGTGLGTGPAMGPGTAMGTGTARPGTGPGTATGAGKEVAARNGKPSSPSWPPQS